MRVLCAVFVAVPLIAQAPFAVMIGRLASISGNRIAVADASGTHTLFSNSATKVWRGGDYQDFSVLHTGDEVTLRYRNDATSRLIVVDLTANIDKVEGKITAVGLNGFQVDGNYDADPQSAYRRGLREIFFDRNTQFDGSLPEDLKLGRDVFAIGLKLDTGELRATRVIVYEGKTPVRPDGTAATLPCGSHRLDQPGPGDLPR